ncbi:MAG: methylated-DNA--[protein]-cysteine S-methyltransferase [Thermodesulfovibrionales bacterium]|nr:methylated-DNA--[protein]-cysteine S-methyltransferase [Thermodesulfovibrionales bacterium]
MTNEGKVLFFDQIETSLGVFYILFDKDVFYGITTILSDEPVEKRFPCYFRGLISVIKRKKIPQRILSQFQEYFDGKRFYFELKTVLDLDDANIYFSPFEIKVWKAIRSIPFGETRTYGWLAREIGRPSSQRAVGQALKRNPLPIVIPCHRIVGSRDLCGYSLGLDLKRRLLMLERYHSDSVR